MIIEVEDMVEVAEAIEVVVVVETAVVNKIKIKKGTTTTTTIHVIEAVA
jgi:hypothetical protein